MEAIVFGVCEATWMRWRSEAEMLPCDKCLQRAFGFTSKSIGKNKKNSVATHFSTLVWKLIIGLSAGNFPLYREFGFIQLLSIANADLSIF